PRTAPWQETLDLKYLIHFEHASTIAFAAHRLAIPKSRRIVQEAVKTILKHQGKSGAWPCWQGHQPSIESTAKAIHALSVTRPRGWKTAVERAGNWLIRQQGSIGCWHESAAPSPTWLTVLVLDAISLAFGMASTSLGIPAPNSDEKSLPLGPFEVA